MHVHTCLHVCASYTCAHECVQAMHVHTCVFVCEGVCVSYACAHVCADACQGQKRTSDPLEVEPQVVVSCLAWVLGTELDSSRRASALNC